nr:thioesterase family protein [uncultured Hyphomonas sp.]
MEQVQDFEQATRLEPLGEGRWRVDLPKSWGLWSPAGGFITALALRAAGEASGLPRPASMTCHFLRMGKYAPAEVRVETVKAGKRSELLQVELIQDGKTLLLCHVWTVPDTLAGLEHDDTQEELPAPESVPSFEEQYPDEPSHPFFHHFEQRPIRGTPHKGDAARDPELTGFYRFTPLAISGDAFADAGRAIILMDAFGWLAQYPAHPTDGPSPWIAPNIDYHYRFHRPTSHADWLHMRVRAPVAENGLMATDGEIRDTEGHLLVSGSSQLMCLPRPGA